MRKTARPVVWEGDRASIPVTRPDPRALSFYYVAHPVQAVPLPTALHY